MYVTQVLLEKFATGLFDRPLTDPTRVSSLNNPAHQALALKAAEEGIVPTPLNTSNYYSYSCSLMHPRDS